MQYNEDMDVFFDMGDPGIVEATHIDQNTEEQPLIGELITKTESHGHGASHINQFNPAFKLPEIHANTVEIGDVLIVDELRYEVVEKLTIANGICLIYLTKESKGGAHRWQ